MYKGMEPFPPDENDEHVEDGEDNARDQVGTTGAGMRQGGKVAGGDLMRRAGRVPSRRKINAVFVKYSSVTFRVVNYSSK